MLNLYNKFGKSRLAIISAIVVLVIALGSVAFATVGWINGPNKQFQTQVTAFNPNASVNWTADQFGNLNLMGVNWTNYAVIAQGSAGVNWQAMDPATGGINWYNLAGAALISTNIMCWKGNGQPGHCTTSVSGVNCTACN